MRPAIPPLALTMGDPAGIGGELTAKAWLARHATGPVFCALDDPARFAAWDVPVHEITAPEQAADVFATALPVLPVRLAHAAQPGKPDPANAPSVLAAIRLAVELAMAGRVGAVVTNPINKAALYQVGFTHPGHTEFLAELTASKIRRS